MFRSDYIFVPIPTGMFMLVCHGYYIPVHLFLCSPLALVDNPILASTSLPIYRFTL